jgi:uncharacterized protein YehS (DUF1456 family)
MKIEFELKNEIIEKVCDEMGFDYEAGKIEIREFFAELDREENYILGDRIFEELLRGVLNV